MDSAALLSLAKLEAEVSGDGRETKHPARNQKPFHGNQESVWSRTMRPLGSGGFGVVYREECISGRMRGAVRAVKSIAKPSSSEQGSKISYANELRTVALFSQHRVSLSTGHEAQS